MLNRLFTRLRRWPPGDPAGQAGRAVARRSHAAPGSPLGGRALAALTVVLALAHCATRNPDTRPAEVGEFKPAQAYRLQPGDEIEIKFYYTPELNERETIRSDGKISMALIDDVGAAGMTVSELHDALRKAYAGQLTDPELTVLLRNPAANRIYVAGEVNLQGAQALSGPTTVSRAVIAAQGLKNSAYRSQVLVVRPEADGHDAVRVVDLGRVLKGEAAGQDVLLQAQDIVYVPSSPIADVDQFVDQYIRQAIPVSGAVTYNFGPAVTSP